MPRKTRINGRSGKGFPPEYARSLGIDEVPNGGIGGASHRRRVEGQVQVVAGWRYAPARVMRNVLVGERIVPRLCHLAP